VTPLHDTSLPQPCMRIFVCFVICSCLALDEDQEERCPGSSSRSDTGTPGRCLLQVNGSLKVRRGAHEPGFEDLANLPRFNGDLDVSYGSKRCPCLGIDRLNGTVYLHFNSAKISFPAEVGSHCHAWDDGKKELKCAQGQTPGAGEKWCAEEWCFVDPCNCKISTPPRESRMAAGITWQGKPLYYSYVTCASIDLWPADQQEKSKEHTADSVCEASENSKHSKSDVSNSGGEPNIKVATGMAQAGSRTQVANVDSEAVRHIGKYGKPLCKCIGRAGVSGTISTQYQNETLQYPAETGSMCKAWDLQSHPECRQESDRPKWCDKTWCYVDPCSCSIPVPPKTSWYLPEATIQGRRIYYSYEACGSEDVYTVNNDLACVNQDTEESCLGSKKCAWGGADVKCLGEELLNTCNLDSKLLEKWAWWAYTGGARDSTRFFGPYDATLLIYFFIMAGLFVALVCHIEKNSEQGWLQPQERGE